MNAFKILVAFSKADKSLFDIPVGVQKHFLELQQKPSSLIDRSYNQYKAQMLFVPWWKIWIQNIVACVLLPFILAYLLFKSLSDETGHNVEAIGEFKGLEETLPNSVTTEFEIDNDVWDDGSSLTLHDLPFVLHVVWGKHPFFALKTIMKIAMYSHSIRVHSPRAIVVHNEYSFTSSALTDYCRLHDVKHINAMHGEKLFYIRDSWFQYDRCYVWDEYYITLFESLNVDKNQFEVEVPPSLKIDFNKFQNTDSFSDYKYYLASYSENELRNIVNSLSPIKKKGYSIKFRPHPRYSDVELLRKYVSNDDIEEPKKVGILESISNCNYVVGSYTTVLLQAYCSGRNVILDDCSNRQEYYKLKELGYILSNKECPKLSDITS